MSRFPFELLKCYEKPRGYNKIRIGRNNDGGYVILDGLEYDLMLGCGINDDDSFEHEFLKRYRNIECYTFDGTIAGEPNPHPRIHFTKKNIGDKNDDKLSNLHEYLDNYKNIFLKMDIEGGEYEWIPTLSNEQLNNISQIAMEIHEPFNEKKWECLEKLNETHRMIHFHTNNNQNYELLSLNEPNDIIEIGNSEYPIKRIKLSKKYNKDTQFTLIHNMYKDRFSYRLIDDILEVRRIDINEGWGYNHKLITNGQYVPQVYEATFIRKRDYEELRLNNDDIPTKLDMANNLSFIDYNLEGYPYINN